jgi:hypothetical protein
VVAGGSGQTVWLRRVAPDGRFRGRRYELEIVLATGERVRRTTRTPVTDIDPHLGVGDAWSIVHAADATWDGDAGDWVTLAKRPGLEPPAP